MTHAIAVRGSLWFDLGRRQWVAIEATAAPEIVKRATSLWTSRTYGTERKGTVTQAYRYEPATDFYMHQMGELEHESFGTATSVIVIIDQESGKMLAGFCDAVECGWTDEDKLGIKVDAAGLVNNMLTAEREAEREKVRRELEESKRLRQVFGDRGRAAGGQLSGSEQARRMEALRRATQASRV
jgi:hypothetical protein